MKRLIIAVIGCSMFLFGSAGSAGADQATLTDASGLEYELYWDTGTYQSTYTSTSTYTTTGGGTTTSTYTTSSSGTYTSDANVDEAEYTQDVTYTTTSGGTAVGQPDDMFDGYNYLSIDGTGFQGMNGTMPLCSGREVYFGEETIAGLTVSRRAFVPDDDEFLRMTTVITNPSAAPISVTIAVDGDMGSDEDTVITASSSGDMVADATDTWFASGGDFDDPRAGHVMQGEGAPVSVATFMQGAAGGSEDEFDWTYDVTVAAGETIVLLNFVTGQPNNADAAAKAEELSMLTEGDAALECLSDDEIAQVVNFVVESRSSGGCGCHVPGGSGTSPLAPMAFGLLVGAWFLRRRRLV